MTIATVTVTGRFQRANSAPARGRVTFTPSTTVRSSSDDVIVSPRPITALLDADGAISVDLVATDAEGTAPTGWTYEITEWLNGPVRTYSIEVPSASAMLDLADVAPVADPDDVTELVTTDTPQTITAPKVFRVPDGQDAVTVEMPDGDNARAIVILIPSDTGRANAANVVEFHAGDSRVLWLNEYGEPRVRASSPARTPFKVIAGGPGQSADLQTWEASDRSIVASIAPGGQVRAPNMPRLARLSADVVEDAGDFTGLTDLGLDIPEPGTYRFQWTLAYSADSTSTGVRLELDGPAFGGAYFSYLVAIASGGHFNQTRFDYSAFAASTVNQANSEFPIWIDGLIVATEAGTLTPRFRTHDEVAGAVTVHAGSFGVLTSR